MTGRTIEDDRVRLAWFDLALREEGARVAKLEAEVGMLDERVTTERDNRRLRFGVAIATLALMAVQVLVVVVNYLFPSERREYA
jgi:hypothetical protein